MRPVRRVFLAAVLAALALPAAAGAASPCKVTPSDRHMTTRINLDAGPAKELVDVFNFRGAGSPQTDLMVCRRSGGRWVRASLRRIWGPGPGNPQSGLLDAWVGNLDRIDRRVEVAARNNSTASVGDQLVIMRQQGLHSLRFSRLQTIAADTVTMKRPKTGSAYVTATVKDTHSIDGQKHTEKWTYSTSRKRWVCSTDCFGRPDYAMTACTGEVPGIGGSAAADIRVQGMTCTSAKQVIAHWMASPHTPVDGFTVTSPMQYRVLGRQGGKAFYFALRGTD